MKILLLLSSFFFGIQLHANDCRVTNKDTIPAISKYLGGNVIKSSSGFVTIYEKDNRFLLEIPETVIGRDILATITILKGVQKNDRKKSKKYGYGDDSMSENMVRFEKKGDVINLVSPEVKYIDNDSFIYAPYYQSLINPTIRAFPVVAMSNNSYLIDITDYYLGDSELFALQGSKTELDLGNYIKESSYSTEIVSYPTNINFRSVRSYTTSKPEESTYSNSLWEIGSSWILLPEKAMEIRPFDQRVGYFSFDIRGQLGDENEKFKLTKRWRLEPKPEDVERYLKGELVVPQKPIVFYIDKDMPAYLIPYVVEAVGDWQNAFEKAGFKNAIYARPEPTKEENPDYSSDDARYSVISYKASPIPNAYGPSIVDPRSGEIITSHVAIFHTVTDLIQMWYFAMCSPSDPMAREYPISQDLMGKLFRTVVTHEIGHTLGLRHNFMGSSNYPVDSLRNNDFIEKNGLGTSIMDYQRFNYIAQPEDHVKQNNLFPKLGTYDKFAIEWGYRYYPDSVTPTLIAEKQNQWVNEEIKKGNRDYLEESIKSDPRVQSEDSGDDVIYANRLGMKNLKYIMTNLEQWTEKNKHDNYMLLKRRYLYVVQQYHKYINHMMVFLGGYYSNTAFCTHQNYVVEYKNVSYEDHVRVLQFLNEYLLEEPTWLTKPSFLDKINLGENDVYTPVLAHIFKLENKGLGFNNSEFKNDDSMTNQQLQNFLFDKLFLKNEKSKSLSYYQKKMQSNYLTQLTINMENQSNISLNTIQFLQSQIFKIKDFAENNITNPDSLTKAHYLGILNFIKIWEQGNQKI